MIASINFLKFLNLLRNYHPCSLPAYISDCIGFHVPVFRHLFNPRRKLVYLQDGIVFLIRPFTHDRPVIDEIFVHKVYNPKHFEIQEGDTVVDLGAHIGIFTVFAAKTAQTVYSYEPEPANFAMLKINIKLNHLDTKVKTFQSAVADKRGFFPLYICEGSARGIASLAHRKTKNILVKAVTLEDVFTENKLSHIDFLKVDVEGTELDIFNSTKESHLTAIKKIAMECHSPLIEKRLTKLFRSVGFRVIRVPGGHPTLSYLFVQK